MLTNSLSEIIRKVPKGTRVTDRRSQKLLIVERKQQSVNILREEPLLASILGSQLGSRLSRYIVANSNDAANVSAGRFNSTLKHAESGTVFDISIRYEVKCPQGQEENALYALCAANRSPEQALAIIIEKCVTTYSRSSDARFFDSYDEFISHLQSEIAQYVNQCTGLLFHAWISLPLAEQLTPFIIQPISFGVSVKGCDDKLAVQLDTELSVDQKHLAKALLKLGKEFELANVIKAGIRRYLREQTSIDAFYLDLEGDIQRDITAFLEPSIVEYGRKIQSFNLVAKATVPATTQIETVNCSMQCNIKGSEPVVFDIHSHLQLELIDIGLYRRQQSPELKRWVQERLNRKVLRAALFGKTYADIVLHFSEVEAAVRRSMTTAAKEIGYCLHAIKLEPDLEPFELAEPFELKLNHKSFSLQDGKTTGDLDIQLRMSLSDLTDISDYLKPGVQIKPLMAACILDEVKAVLISTEASAFDRWLLASQNRDNEQSEAFTLEDALMPHVREALEGRFKAAVESMAIAPSDPEFAPPNA